MHLRVLFILHIDHPNLSTQYLTNSSLDCVLTKSAAVPQVTYRWKCYPLSSSVRCDTFAHPPGSQNFLFLDLPLLALGPVVVEFELLGIGLEEVDWLLRMLPGDVDEGRSADVVRLAFFYQGVVFEEVLTFGFVVVAYRELLVFLLKSSKTVTRTLSVENLFRFSSVTMQLALFGIHLCSSAYSEMSSNSILVPKAWLAASASSSPAASMGPCGISFLCLI